MAKKGKQNGPVKLPRTGIDQPFLRDRPVFKDSCHDFEPIAKFNTSLCDEYERMEAERPLNNQSEKVVYDCMEVPVNKDKEGGPYIDENDLVELPQDD